MEVYLACWTIPRIGAAERYKHFILIDTNVHSMNVETAAEDVEVDSEAG
jgi:hypothetical protein